MQKLVIFGSGKGSNARRIIEYFNQQNDIEVVALVSNKPRRGFLDISYEFRINLEIIKGDELSDPKWLAHFKMTYRPDLIVLVGFLKKIPTTFIEVFPGKIINLHPSLLPKFGGKGMYGSYVHDAVIASKEKESGITIHQVNEKYDEGNILFQEKVLLDTDETSESLADKINMLEYKHLPIFIEWYMKDKKYEKLQ
jgi:phosphoribosylglycinamide formyltransferase-1